MQASIVRLEMSPEAAALTLGCVERLHGEVTQRLTGIVPIHTKAALEKQLADAEEARRVIELAVANPVEVDIPDPPGFSA